MQHKPPLNLQQAAAQVGLKRRQFVSCQQGPTPPPAFRIGKQWFFWEQDLVEWNRQRLAGLKRHWKRHAVWQESH